MLQRLTVQNLAIIESAEVEFAPALNVITGETGAGKSVLMGALALIAGGRADAGQVRDGAKEARVEAEFALEPGVDGMRRRAWGEAEKILQDAGIGMESGQLVVRRTIGAAGGGRIWINDAAASAGLLKKIGRLLVDIHGARANDQILAADFQRRSLDGFGGVRELGAYQAYQAAWAKLKAVKAELAELEAEGDVEEELDMLEFQVGELDAASLEAEDENIADKLRQAEKSLDAARELGELIEILDGEYGLGAVAERLNQVLRALAKLVAEAEEWEALGEEIVLKAQELSRGAGRAQLKLEDGDNNVEELDKRLTLVNRLKRKYRAASVAELLAALDKKRARLERLRNLGADVARLKAEAAELERTLTKEGAEISAARRKCAGRLAAAVTKELKDLGFAKARFEVRVEADEPGSEGLDKVDYMFEPNPGESARELAEIASSGEAARVMLALKSVLSAHDGTTTMVFDEIDANIGGEVGRTVGEKLRQVAAHHQVIAITHLPQSAVFGLKHLKVEKTVADGRTRAAVREVAGEERTHEIARMLGGEDLTTVTRKHAEELLNYGKNC